MTKVHEIQKRIKNKKTEEVKKEPKNNKLKIFFMKLLIIVSTVLILTIVIKNNSSLKNKIYKYVYNTNFSFHVFLPPQIFLSVYQPCFQSYT